MEHTCIALLLFLFSVMRASAYSEPNLAWSSLNIELPGNVESIRYLNDKFIIIGGYRWFIGESPGSGFIATSNDGISWNIFTPDDHLDLLSDAAYGNGKFVVTGDDGGVFVSDDGINWTPKRIGDTFHDLSVIAFGNGRFVALPRNRNLVYTSTDGENWSIVETNNTQEVEHVSWVNGHFIAVGDRGTLLFSEDGLIWDEKQLDPMDTIMDGDEYLFSVEYGKGRYVVGGYFFTAYSPDGVIWHIQPAPFQVLSVQYHDGWFVAFGNTREYMTSRDGSHWEVHSNVDEGWSFRAAQHAGKWVGAADNYLYRTLTAMVPHPFEINFLHTHELELFLEVGSSYTLWKSVDLKDWSPETVQTGSGEFYSWPIDIKSESVFYRVTKD